MCAKKKKEKKKKKKKERKKERNDMLCFVFVSVYLSAGITRSAFSLASN